MRAGASVKAAARRVADFRWPWRKPRIRTVLTTINLVLLLLPLTGVWMLRLYESALVRQTESELIAQGAVIVAAYRAEWLRNARQLARGVERPSRALNAMPIASVGKRPQDFENALGSWTPHFAVLDLADDPVLPPPDPAKVPDGPAERFAAAAGAAVTSILIDAQRMTLAAMRVTDLRGIVVATTREELGLSLAEQNEVKAALSGQAVSALRSRAPLLEDEKLTTVSRGALVRVFVALPVIEEGRILGAVMLSRTPASIEQALYGKRWHLAGLLLVLLGIGVTTALFTAYTVSRPIRVVAAQAKAVAAGARVSLTRTRRNATREAEELWSAIRTIADTLERRADYIRIFAAEASHEFKTPLTALRGTIEILREHGETMSPSERDRFLANLAEDSERLDLLVRRLLDMARAEAAVPPEGAAAADVGETVRRVAASFRALGLSVSLDEPGVPARAEIRSEALHAVLSNLLDNVRQHAGRDAAATIRWRIAENGRVELIVSDTGAGISAGNRRRVFDRFFTTAREKGGTGLGLPIARGHVSACGGTIDLLSDGPGTRFLISLPPG